MRIRCSPMVNLRMGKKETSHRVKMRVSRRNYKDNSLMRICKAIISLLMNRKEEILSNKVKDKKIMIC